MRYMQIIKARSIDEARNSYLQLLQKRGVTLTPATAVFVETVHRDRFAALTDESWLCYMAAVQPRAA